MNIKELSEKAEIEQYASTPPSGRGTGEMILSLDGILPNIKQISLRKPFAMIVGSMATQGKSNNDIDIVVRGEDLSDKVKEAINFRLYRLFTSILKCAYDDVTKYVHIHYNNTGSYTSYIPLYELNLVPTNFETIKMSTMPFALRGNIHLINKSENQRIIAGYANVAIVDSEEQFIPIETLKKGIETLLRDPHYSNLMLVHQNIQIGKIIDKFGEYTTHVDDKGFYIVAEIRQDLKIANEIWEKILNNEISSFSIGCEVLRDHKQCDEEKCIQILDEINIFEVSICTHPVNEESGFKVVSKSKFGKVCDECNLEIEKKMTNIEEPKVVKQDEKKSGEPVKVEEIKKETPQPSDKILELEQKISALEAQLLEAKKPVEAAKPCSEEPKEEWKPEDMAIFMLDYIINNPKAKAQDIAKAWIESKKVPPKEPIPEPTPIEEPKPAEPKPEEGKYPEPSKYPYPEKMGEVVDKLSAIVDKLTKLSSEEELKLAVKSRDDQIGALQIQLKELSKDKTVTESAGTPKTVVNTENIMEKDSPIKIERGTVYYND